MEFTDRAPIESHLGQRHVLPSVDTYHIAPFVASIYGMKMAANESVAWLKLPSSGTWELSEVCFNLDDSLINNHGQRLPFTQSCLSFVLEYPPREWIAGKLDHDSTILEGTP